MVICEVSPKNFNISYLYYFIYVSNNPSNMRVVWKDIIEVVGSYDDHVTWFASEKERVIIGKTLIVIISKTCVMKLGWKTLSLVTKVIEVD